MTRTILLADDSVTIQKVVELTFLDEDVRVVAVGNGADAIARLDEVRPGVVIADVHMPGADGYEVCAAARDRLPGVPVLLLVGTFEVFDAARAAEAGAAGHLKKPFDSQDLLRRVRELLDAAPAAAGPAAFEAAPAPAPEPWFAPEPAAPAEEPEPVSWSFEPVGEPGEPGEPLAAEPAAAAAPEWLAEPYEPVLPELPPAEEPAPEPMPLPVSPPAAPPAELRATAPAQGLSEEDVDRIARRVIELGGERIVRDIAWEVVPDLAEVLLKARIRELEASVE